MCVCRRCVRDPSAGRDGTPGGLQTPGNGSLCGLCTPTAPLAHTPRLPHPFYTPLDGCRGRMFFFADEYFRWGGVPATWQCVGGALPRWHVFMDGGGAAWWGLLGGPPGGAAGWG